MLKSFEVMALRSSPPEPVIKNICSMKTLPIKLPNITTGKNVAIGNKAGLSACVQTKRRFVIPFK